MISIEIFLFSFIKELSDFIHSHSQSDASNPFSPVGDSSSSLFLSSDPFSLVGKTIQHRFCLESGEHKWFCGAVISYNPVAKTHEIAYEDEEEHQHYDLTDDIEGGDIQVDNFDN